MNTGKTLFAQLMDFLPWTTFTRIVDRYGGDHRVRTLLRRANRSMAFAQLTYRESLRDIETCLSVHASKLYHMGFRAGPALDAGDERKARLAYPCGVGPAAHHPGEDAVSRRRTGVGPGQYRLRPGLDDHRSVPVGLSVGALPHHQGGGEDAHAARPAGQHSEFYPHLGASCTTFMPSICSCRKPEPSTSWIVATSTLPAFMCCPKPGPSSSTQVEHRCSSRLFGADGSLDRHHLRPDHLPGRLLHPSGLPRTSAGIRFKTPSPARRWSSSPTTSRFRPPPSARSTKAAGRWNFLRKQHLRIKQFYGTSENAVDADLDCRLGDVLVAIVKKRLDLDARLYTLLQILSVTLRENAHTSSTCGRRNQRM